MLTPSDLAPVRCYSVRVSLTLWRRTDSSRLRALQLPTWVSGVQTPFGGLVKFYFRRHLERAAAQKYGADGVEAARQKQAERKEKRVQSRVDDKESKVAQVEEVLKDNGFEGGFRALYLLGHSLAAAVQRFVDPKAAGKKRRGGCVLPACIAPGRALSAPACSAAADPPLELSTIEQVSGASFLLMLRRFSALTRWPALCSCDSQGAHPREAPHGAQRGMRAGWLSRGPHPAAGRICGIRCALFMVRCSFARPDCVVLSQRRSCPRKMQRLTLC